MQVNGFSWKTCRNINNWIEEFIRVYSTAFALPPVPTVAHCRSCGTMKKISQSRIVKVSSDRATKTLEQLVSTENDTFVMTCCTDNSGSATEIQVIGKKFFVFISEVPFTLNLKPTFELMNLRWKYISHTEISESAEKVYFQHDNEIYYQDEKENLSCDDFGLFSM